MTNRERILAVLDGRRPDRIPWVPRLGIWYRANKLAGTLPPEYRDMSLRQVELDVFGGTAARKGRIWESELDGVEIRARKHNGSRLVEYVTPVGAVSTEFRRSEQPGSQGMCEMQVGFMLKRPEDYPVVQYIVEHTRYTPAFDEYERYEREIGDDGYPMIITGDCPFHYWMQQLAGYDNAFFHLHDHAAVVERLLDAITDHYRATIWRQMLDSPARLLQHGIHFSTQMTPPPLFEQYILPYYQELTPLLRRSDKVVALHADSDLGGLLPLVERAGFGMVECLATSPLVPLTLAQAQAAWGNRVIIWGGVPSTILEEPYSDEQFEQYMQELLATVSSGPGPGKAFIMGISDNAMPNSKIGRIRRVSELLSRDAEAELIPNRE
ncbi:MAG: uroporphyrinogen decarboxylase family protein [Planctomycetota bacterium]|nr:uroporphyrinogen decarboxylase family protein [Planctomycetota bacterium]